MGTLAPAVFFWRESPKTARFGRTPHRRWALKLDRPVPSLGPLPPMISNFSKLSTAALLAFNLVSGSDAAEARGSTVQPVPRADANSKTAHEQLVAKAKAGRIDLYFVGDSITRRWGSSDTQYSAMLASWRTNFHGWNAGNFGWGADSIQNILWRLTNGELDGVNPKVIVLLAGTNNLRPGRTGVGDDKQVEEVVGGIHAILDVFRSKAPGASVILMGVLPRNEAGGKTALIPTIRRINTRLAAFADGDKIRFLDIGDRLADPTGKLVDGVTVDGLHLSVKGYQIWADALKPLLGKRLGLRAAVDLAPPPTGDPSAVRPVAR